MLAVGRADAEVLDDSLSPKQQHNVQLEWVNSSKPFSLSMDALNALVGCRENVEVRLATKEFIGQRARIFLTLPEQIKGLSSSAGFVLSWTTQGLFSSGSTTPGNQVQIFDGAIDSTILVDFFTFTLELDARNLSGVMRLEPVYEIEVF
jgi:hypothetical protein